MFFFVATDVVEACRFIDAEDRRVAWGVDEGFGRAAFNVVLDSVEEQLGAQEVEEVAGGLFGDVGLVVEEVEVWFVGYRFAFVFGGEVEGFDYLGGQVWDRQWICWMR